MKLFIRHSIEEWREPVELYPSLMLLLLFVLALENLLSNRFYKQ